MPKRHRPTQLRDDLASHLAPGPSGTLEPDQARRDGLVQDHLDYAHALAAKLRSELGAELPLDELRGYAARGLLEAADRFDPTRGAAFTTFAYYRIRGAVFDGLREIGWLDRGSWARCRAATNELLDNLSQREVADPHGASGSLEANLGAIADTLGQVCTVFLTADAAENLADERQQDVDEVVATKQASQAVRQAVRALPARERQLVEMFYFKGISLKAAGAKLGLSGSWASRLHARAIRLLTESLQL